MLIVKTYNIPNKLPKYTMPKHIIKHCYIYKEAKDRHTSLFTWMCLSKYINLEKVRFTKNGKPYLLGNKKYFSLSHSFDMVAIGISDKPIGIDIEKVLPLSLASTLASRLVKGKDLISYHNAPDQSLWFTKHWTKYEAFNKLKGGKLSFKTFKDKIKGSITTKIILSDNEQKYVLTYLIYNKREKEKYGKHSNK